jgi:glutamate synthase domain-containing protein 3
MMMSGGLEEGMRTLNGLVFGMLGGHLMVRGKASQRGAIVSGAGDAQNG